MIRMIFAAALLVAVAAQPCLAQQPPPAESGVSPEAQAAVTDPVRLEAARRVVRANGSEANERTIIEQMMPIMARQMGHAEGLTDAQIADTTRIVTSEMQSSVAELLEIFVQLYAQHFTTEQLNALADFYESPAGRAYVTEMPSLLHDSIVVSQQWAQTSLAPRVAARIRALMQQQHPQHS